MSEQFGDALRRARQHKSMIQEEVAAIFGVSTPTVFRWEKGSHQPMQGHYPKLAEFIGVSERDVWELINNTSDKSRLDVLELKIARIERHLGIEGDLSEELEAVVAAATAATD